MNLLDCGVGENKMFWRIVKKLRLLISSRFKNITWPPAVLQLRRLRGSIFISTVPHMKWLLLDISHNKAFASC